MELDVLLSSLLDVFVIGTNVSKRGNNITKLTLLHISFRNRERGAHKVKLNATRLERENIVEDTHCKTTNS